MHALTAPLASTLRLLVPHASDRAAGSFARTALFTYDRVLESAPPAPTTPHSPTPWRVANGGGEFGAQGQPKRFVRSARGALVVCASEGTAPRGHAAARRIAASVTACEGTPTEVLEALASPAAAGLAQNLGEALRALLPSATDSAPMRLAAVAQTLLSMLDAYAQQAPDEEDIAPGPWIAGGTRSGIPAPQGVFDRFIRDSSRAPIGLAEGPALQAAADARRIVACVNACRGLAVQQLEQLQAWPALLAA